MANGVLDELGYGTSADTNSPSGTPKPKKSGGVLDELGFGNVSTPVAKPTTPTATIEAAPAPSFLEKTKRAILGQPSEENLLGRMLHTIRLTASSPDERAAEALTKPPVQRDEIVTPEALIDENQPDTTTGYAKDLVRGGLKTVGGFTTPGSLATIAATGGLGRAVSLIGKLGPYVPRLVSAGFGIQMLKSAYDNNEPFRKAADSGDFHGALNILGQMVGEGVGAGLAISHATTGGEAGAQQAHNDAIDSFTETATNRLKENGLTVPADVAQQRIADALKGQSTADIKTAAKRAESGSHDEKLRAIFPDYEPKGQAQSVAEEIGYGPKEPTQVAENPQRTPQEGDAVALQPTPELRTLEDKTGLTADEHGNLQQPEVETPSGIAEILRNPEAAKERFPVGSTLPAAMSMAELRAIERATGYQLGHDGRLHAPETFAPEVDPYEEARQAAGKEGERVANINNVESPQVVGETQPKSSGFRREISLGDAGVQGEKVGTSPEELQAQAEDRAKKLTEERQQQSAENPLVTDKRNAASQLETSKPSAKESAPAKPVNEMSREELAAELEASRQREHQANQREKTNPVSGLPNRKAFDELQANPESQHPFVAQMDLDGLKALNDEHGYHLGDSLLQSYAGSLEKASKGTKVRVFHEKGDEFIASAPSKAELSSVLEKARQMHENGSFSVVNPANGKILRVEGKKGVTDGIGTNLAEAEKQLHANKRARVDMGQHARRGDLGPIRVTELSANQGNQNNAPGRGSVRGTSGPGVPTETSGETGEGKISPSSDRPKVNPLAKRDSERGSLSFKPTESDKERSDRLFEKLSSAAEKYKPKTEQPKPQTEKTDTASSDNGKFAGSINLDKLNTPDDVKQFIRDVAKKNSDFTQQRRGVQSHETTQDLADKLGMSPEELAKVKKASTFNAEELHAAGNVMLQTASDVQTAAKAYRDGGNKMEDLLRYQEAYEKHVAVQSAVSGLKSEAGRALNAAKIIHNATSAETNSHTRVLDTLREHFGDKWEEKSQSIMQRLAQIPEGDTVGLTKFLRETAQFPAAQHINSYFIANLLSGPKTPIKKFLGDVFFGATQPAVRALRGAIDNPVSKLQGRQQEFYVREAVPAAQGYFAGLSDGLRKAAHIMRDGFDSKTAEQLDIPVSPEFKGDWMNPLNHPRRLLSAVTSMFQTMAFNGELYAQATRAAIKEGLSGEQMRSRAAEFIANPTPEIIKAAEKQSKYETYTSNPDGLARAAMIMQSSVKIPESVPLLGGAEPVRFIVPFVRIPYNLTKAGLEHTPVGLLKLANKDVLKSSETSNVLAKQVIGAGIMGTAAMLAASGSLTGAAPKDPNKREAFYADGKKEYSVKVGDSWIPYNHLGWLGIPMAAVAAFYDNHGETGEIPTADRLQSAAAASAQSVMDQTFFKGLANFLDAVRGWESTGTVAGGVKSVVANLAAGFIPLSSLLRQVEHSIDPKVRDAQDIYDRVKSGIPILANSLPVKQDRFGRDVERTGDVSAGAFVPENASTASPRSAIDTEIDRLGIPIGHVTKDLKVDGQKSELNPDQKREFQTFAGRRMYSDLSDLITDPDYKDLSDDERKELLERQLMVSRRAARLEFADQLVQRNEAVNPLQKKKR
jgi:GGDEF domain-containing protein